ncbi:MAG: hypothetical protein GWN93_05930 [Deltaproteobacteria bacterium]|nr:hypothetical protein [Deltaproteobacteria bacterium]
MKKVVVETLFLLAYALFSVWLLTAVGFSIAEALGIVAAILAIKRVRD